MGRTVRRLSAREESKPKQVTGKFKIENSEVTLGSCFSWLHCNQSR
jgi:hypothetical protein